MLELQACGHLLSVAHDVVCIVLHEVFLLLQSEHHVALG